VQADATVLQVTDGTARVSCASHPSCGACRTGCALRWLGGGGRILDVPVDRVLERTLEPGQDVRLAVSDAELLRAAGRAYLTPLAGVVLGPLLARVSGAGELAALLAAAAGLAAGWAVARAWFRRSPPRLSVYLEPSADA
jgi:positive regulator of sigma E activity